jgi:hypothetical protein
MFHQNKKKVLCQRGDFSGTHYSELSRYLATHQTTNASLLSDKTVMSSKSSTPFERSVGTSLYQYEISLKEQFCCGVRICHVSFFYGRVIFVRYNYPINLLMWVIHESAVAKMLLRGDQSECYQSFFYKLFARSHCLTIPDD